MLRCDFAPDHHHIHRIPSPDLSTWSLLLRLTPKPAHIVIGSGGSVGTLPLPATGLDACCSACAAAACSGFFILQGACFLQAGELDEWSQPSADAFVP